MDVLSSIKKGAALFIAPLPLIALGLIVSNWLVWQRNANRSIKWALSITTFAFVVLSSPIASTLALRWAEESYPVYRDTHNNIDNIIVLGCWHRTDPNRPLIDNAHSCTLFRLLEAVRLSKVYPSAQIILSGFSANPMRAESVSHPHFNASVLEAIGIQAEKMLIVEGAKDTREESIMLAPIVRGQENLLVSSASHLRRAATLFKQQKIEVTPVPARYLTGSEIDWSIHSLIPSVSALERSQRAMYEIMGITWVWLSEQ